MVNNFIRLIFGKTTPAQQSRETSVVRLTYWWLKWRGMLPGWFVWRDWLSHEQRGNFRQSFGAVVVDWRFVSTPSGGLEKWRAVDDALLRLALFFRIEKFEGESTGIIELIKSLSPARWKVYQFAEQSATTSRPAKTFETLNTFYKSEEEIRDLKVELHSPTQQTTRPMSWIQRALSNIRLKACHIWSRCRRWISREHVPSVEKHGIESWRTSHVRKNDIDKCISNESSATIVRIDHDDVKVEMARKRIFDTKLKRERWENKKYTLNKERKDLDEEVLVHLNNNPIKLCIATYGAQKVRAHVRASYHWCLAKAFADGQVYVALSWLRSLTGLVLWSRINPGVISTDRTIAAYSKDNHKPRRCPNWCDKSKWISYGKCWPKPSISVDFSEIEYFRKNHEEDFIAPEMKPVPIQIHEALEKRHQHREVCTSAGWFVEWKQSGENPERIGEGHGGLLQSTHHQFAGNSWRTSAKRNNARVKLISRT